MAITQSGKLIVLWHALLMLYAICTPEVFTLQQHEAEYADCQIPQGSLPCKVWNFTNLDCSNRQLDCIPHIPHANPFQMLNLHWNSLSVIPSYGFSDFHQLKYLELSANSISFLQPKAFSGLEDLQYLDLSGNDLSSTGLETFEKLSKLLTLDMTSNSQEVLEEHNFRGLVALQHLRLSQNSIAVIKDCSFCGLRNLYTLDLSFNSLGSLEDSPFRDLLSLYTLDLSFNSLGSLEDSPFHDLLSLKILNLKDNSMIVLTDATFTGLKNLQSLHINGLYLNDSSITPFNETPSLRVLGMSVSFAVDTDYVVDTLFSGLINLEKLTISTYYSNSNSYYNICSLISLSSLVLTNGNIVKDKCVQNVPLLNFKYNGDVIINPPYFLLPHLIYLSIGITSNISDAMKALQSLNSPIQKLVFSFFIDLTLHSSTFEVCSKWSDSLHHLEIYCWSACTNVTFKAESFRWFSQLRTLTIQGLVAPFVFHKDTFKGLNILEQLILTEVRSEIFASGALQIFSNYNTLKVLNFKNGRLTGEISGKQLCNISSSLQTIDLSLNSFDSSSGSGYFPCTLLKLQTLWIDYMHFEDSLNFNIMCQSTPNVTTCSAVDTGTFNFETCSVDTCRCPKLSFLDLSGDYLYFEPKNKVYTPSLEELHMSRCSLENIKIMNIFITQHLKHLDLSHNLIAYIDEQISDRNFANLIYLDLSNNELTSISLNFLQHFKGNVMDYKDVFSRAYSSKSGFHSLEYLDLSDNQFVCDCDIQSLATWLVKDKLVRLISYDSINDDFCCVSPYTVKGLSITEVDLDYCKSYMWLYITVVTVCITIIIPATFLIIWYRWHIQYRLFLLFNRRRNHQNYLVNDDDAADRIDDDEDGVPRYDAYVTYHRDDEDWVDEQLVENIEEGEEPFRLCLRTRDIRAGRLIFNELSLHIQRSRKILVILSPRFVEDNWCYFELNMAHHRVIEENRNVMIFIILENIPNNKMTLLLRQLFCRVQVFRWPGDRYGQRLFWQRVREELKRPVPLDRRFNI